MSENITDLLSEDAIHEVIKWLDTGSVKNLMLSSKQFAAYGRRSHLWTLNLAVAFAADNPESHLDAITASTRKYRKVVLPGWHNRLDCKVLLLFQKHGECIRQLTTSRNDNTPTGATWRAILSSMPNLKEVRSAPSWWFPSSSEVSVQEMPPLRKLTRLSIDPMSPALPELFGRCNLLSLTLAASMNIWLDDMHYSGTFWGFLAAQGGLKELNLDYRSCSTMFDTTQRTVPFQLRKFSVSGSARNELSEFAIGNMTDFITQQGSTLEAIALRSAFPNSFYNTVVGLRHLKTLVLTVDRIPQSPLGGMRRNVSVIKLQLNILPRIVSTIAARRFVRHFPNVQKLRLSGAYDFLFVRFIADNMKQLKVLDLDRLEPNTFHGVRFAALKSLRIRQLDCRVNWVALAMINPAIRNVWIGNAKEEINLGVYALLRNFKLHKLTIESYNLNCNETFFEGIRKNCPDLHLLHLNERSLRVNISTVTDIPGLQFRQF